MCTNGLIRGLTKSWLHTLNFPWICFNSVCSFKIFYSTIQYLSMRLIRPLSRAVLHLEQFRAYGSEKKIARDCAEAAV